MASTWPVNEIGIPDLWNVAPRFPNAKITPKASR